MTHLRKEDYYVASVSLQTCQEMVARLHYSRGGSNTAIFRHGLMRVSDDRVRGVAWWIPPTKTAAKAWWPNWKRVLVLHRLVVEPEEPTNAASFLIANSIKLIKADGRWEFLLTYADQAQGHDGTIYKATNWEYLGEVPAAGNWIDEAGRLVHRKVGPKTRTKAEMESLGYRLTEPFAKHRFGMKLIDPRKKLQRVQLRLPLRLL